MERWPEVCDGISTGVVIVHDDPRQDAEYESQEGKKLP